MPIIKEVVRIIYFVIHNKINEFQVFDLFDVDINCI